MSIIQDFTVGGATAGGILWIESVNTSSQRFTCPNNSYIFTINYNLSGRSFRGNCSSLKVGRTLSGTSKVRSNGVDITTVRWQIIGASNDCGGLNTGLPNQYNLIHGSNTLIWSSGTDQGYSADYWVGLAPNFSYRCTASQYAYPYVYHQGKNLKTAFNSSYGYQPRILSTGISPTLTGSDGWAVYWNVTTMNCDGTLSTTQQIAYSGSGNPVTSAVFTPTTSPSYPTFPTLVGNCSGTYEQ